MREPDRRRDTVTVLHPLYVVARECALDGGLEYFSDANAEEHVYALGEALDVIMFSPAKDKAVLFANLRTADQIAHPSKAFIVVLTRDEDLKEWGRA